MDCPVYLFTGFLESGKTKFIRETLEDPNFFEDESAKVLVLLCEEGEEEFDPTQFASDKVDIETLDDPKYINTDKLEALRRKHDASIVIIEYNGMWLVTDLFQALPEDWVVYQEVMMCDASTVEVYNANMRNLVVDKLSSADLVIFNRCDGDTVYDDLHKIVRGVSRRADIIYQRVDGSAAYDDIEDPLPFDVDAPTVEIGDSDYALFYRDLSDNMENYNGKTVRFLGQANCDSRLPKHGFIIGRPIMTCCVEDIAFSGLFCESGAEKISAGGWTRLTAKIEVKSSSVYGRRGPVLKFISAEDATPPADPVATFY
ncbi:MAG: hypothetical protein IKN38_01590 [Clostridia bacterium]|nr:hypothetical protein [Clostridia bacterium]